MDLKVKVVAFDFYGTLADLEAVAAACTEIVPHPQAFVATWRSKQLEYTFRLSLMRRYRDFEKVTEAALEFTLQHFALEVDREQRRHIMDAWLYPAAYPEACSVLSLLAGKYELLVLSNGTPKMLEAGLERTGLRPHFQRLLSADAVRRYKPAPEVYGLVLKKTGLAKPRVLFVSSNGFDVTGAKSYGFKVCWVNRRRLPLDPLGFEPDLTVSDLTALARTLGVDTG